MKRLFLHRLLIAIAGACLAAPAAWAESPFGEPKAGYAADYSFTGGPHPWNGRTYGDLHRQRFDFVGPKNTVSIIRYIDENVGYLLMSPKFYAELRTEKVVAFPGDAPGMTWQTQAEGEEEVDGLTWVKYRAKGSHPQGYSFDGHIWATAGTNIVVRVEGHAIGERYAMDVVYKLSNLKLGAQDDSLWEPPPGATKLGTGVDPKAMPGIGTIVN